jgi:uncharacterized damage-inducible protein DinB
MEEILTTLENSRAYTIKTAETMPENLYTFKPTDAVWNFGELMHHIAYGIQWWEQNYVKGTKTDWNPGPVKKHKKEIIRNLSEAYDSLKRTIGAQKLSNEGVKGFYATLDHITHHRGQAVVYLRMKDIAPPEYVY